MKDIKNMSTCGSSDALSLNKATSEKEAMNTCKVVYWWDFMNPIDEDQDVMYEGTFSECMDFFQKLWKNEASEEYSQSDLQSMYLCIEGLKEIPLYDIFAFKGFSEGTPEIEVVRIPDYAGGYQHEVREKDTPLGDFEYVEWEGSIDKMLEKEPIFFNHYEPFHEDTKDFPVSGWALLREFLTK